MDKWAALGEGRRAADPRRAANPASTQSLPASTQPLPEHVRFNRSKGPFTSLTKIPVDDLLGPLEELRPRTFPDRIPSRVGQRLTSLATRNSERS
jgi:hypothetical protein